MNPDRKKIERIKNVAAQRAFTAYSEAIEEAAKEAGMSLVDVFEGEWTHIHDAVLFADKKLVLVRCRWDASDRAAVVEDGLRRARAEGAG